METPAATSPREWPAGWHVDVVETTGSTNADLVALARAGAPDRTVLAARHQTAGRGRLDRTWTAPPGVNLLVSVLFRDPPPALHVLTQRVALAAKAAVEAVSTTRVELKWPNDLLVDDRKLAGVLAQAEFGAEAGVATFVVIGIGLNVGWAPEGAARLGDGIDPLDVLVELLRAYDALPADVTAAYRGALGTLGRLVHVELPGGEVLEGRAVDVEPDGRLVVLDECAVTHRLDVADVVHVRRAE